MSTLVLQAAGGLIGGLFGPVGAVIGRAVGAMGGYMLDNALISSTRRIEGPRLTSSRPMTAEEGAPLPAIYGTMRVGGTLIWTTRFEEQQTTSRQGGKGGPKTTSYSYYANVAFAVAQGEISGIRRIWADGKELDQTGVTMRVYNGSEDQQPDPLIEARQKAGKAPAYRGTAYVVFERLPVDVYGNRLPLMQFEVMRNVGRLAGDIRAVALIPGATEFGLAPQPVRDEPKPGETRLLNRNNLRAQSDWSASLDELQALCPNLQQVALIVPWFGTDLRAGECLIRPAVTSLSVRNPSHAWRVGSVERHNAMLVSNHDGLKAYGGTPSDFSVRDAIADAKRRGLKVTLSPFIMMDIPENNKLPPLVGDGFQPPYPWRGRISVPQSIDKTMDAATQVNQFYNRQQGYAAFIRHYLQLAKDSGGVDGFLIGSELCGLTRIRDAQNDFPFVASLCALASEARSVLGVACSISYGADWSEYFGYHPQDGSGDVFFNLDPLWAHPAINAIGIDNYMPLSDWRDGDERALDDTLPPSAYDEEALRAGVMSGEGYDWYYANSSDRLARRRSPISDGLAGKPWVFRYKDLLGWWENAHYNRIGGAEQTQATAWQPRSKPFWFTELGCAAVDKGPNQPNMFSDAKSVENAVPYFSDGSRSDLAADRFLRAHYSFWSRPENNPVSPIYHAPMLDISQIYIWAWDTRPFPEFPLKAHIWGDAANWPAGHWLNGRLSGMALDEIFLALLKDCGLENIADCRGVEGYLAGFIADNPVTLRALFEPLMELFGVMAYERQADKHSLVLRSLSQRQQPVFIQSYASEQDGQYPALVLEDARELPASAEVFFSDPLRDYQAGSALALKTGKSSPESLSVAASLENGLAQSLIENWLDRKYAERRNISFALPWTQAALTVGDRVRLPDIAGERDYIITALEDGIMRRVKAHALAPVIRRPDRGRVPVLPPVTGAPMAGPPLFYLLDLPLWPGAENEQQQFRIACYAKPWQDVVVYASPEDRDYQLRSTIRTPAITGILLSTLSAADSGRFFHQASIDVQLARGAMQSRTMQQMLNGANFAALRTEDTGWEIIQFSQAEEYQPDCWRLKGLLRGQAGTEAEARHVKNHGAPFVLLDENVVPAGLQSNENGLMLNWRAGPSGRDFSDDYFRTQSASGGVRARQCLSPAHLRCQRKTNGDFYFSWTRRGRVDADSWEGEDIPLGEAVEKYYVTLSQGEKLIRFVETTSAEFVYNRLLQAEDRLVSGVFLRFEVAQISLVAGRGAVAALSFQI